MHSVLAECDLFVDTLKRRICFASATAYFLLTACEYGPYQIELSWDAPMERETGEPLAGNEIKSYTVFLRRESDNELVRVVIFDGDKYSGRINGLPPGDYRVYMFCTDVYGNQSAESESVYVTVEEE